MPKIYLYAEVLTHIRQLTLHASLQSDRDESPEIDISSDKKVITVKHDGESSSLYLPTQILGTANVTFETHKRAELNARIQIEDLQEWKDIETAGIEAPWVASELTSCTAIRCRSCEEVLLSSQSISAWKDLPSQDWADVMDLWYCHKPHEGDDTTEQKDAAKAKGTSATSRLISQQGTGMVDLTSFVLNPDDCANIKISDRENENDFKSRTVNCSNCSTLIGSFSTSENLVRLNKSDLGVKLTIEDSYISYDPSTFIGAQLLSLIETTPIRKIVVHSSHTSQSKSQPQFTSDSTGPAAQAGKPESSDTTTSDETAELSTSLSTSSPSLSNQIQEHLQEHKTQPSTSPTSPQKEPNSNTNTEQNSDSSESAGLLLWIFNPNIYYSSSLHPSNRNIPQPKSKADTESNEDSAQISDLKPSSPDTKTNSNIDTNTNTNNTNTNPKTSSTSPPKQRKIATAHRALKIFYKPLSRPSLLTYLPHLQQPSTSKPNTSTLDLQIEDLPLPSQSHLASLNTTLRTSTSMLPHTARKFQDWNVGLLDRFERKETAEEVLGLNPLARRNGDESDSEGKGMKGTMKWELPPGWEELYA